MKIHITVDVKHASASATLRTARALTHYAALLIDEALGGPVISGERKLTFGETRLAIDVERDKDYEPPEN